MNLEEFLNALDLYKKENKNCWIGLHDCHSTDETKDNILSSGLSVSHSAFSKRMSNIKDMWGDKYLEHAFMATIYHLNKGEQPFTKPICPIIINIPKVVLEQLNGSPEDSEFYKIVSEYGYQGIEPNPNHVGYFRRTQIEKPSPEHPANTRYLDSYFIHGYFDMKSGEFIENPKFFSNLSAHEQEKIINVLKELKSEDKKPQNVDEEEPESC